MEKVNKINKINKKGDLPFRRVEELNNRSESGVGDDDVHSGRRDD